MMRGVSTNIVLLLAMPTWAADYVKDVKPLLAARCTACHGALAQKAKLRLDTAAFIKQGGRSDPAVVPGKGSQSLLIHAVIGKDRERMPPENEGVHLTAKQVKLLNEWIDAGAKAPDNEAIPDAPRQHWAFQKPVRPTPPGYHALGDGHYVTDLHLMGVDNRTMEVPGRKRLEIDHGQVMKDVAGHCFFTTQDQEGAFAGSGLYIGFGHLSGNDAKGVAAGKLLQAALEAEGFTVEWDGTIGTRLFVQGFRWQKRTPE